MSFAAPPSSIGALRRRHGFVVAAWVISVGGCATLTPQEQDTVADVQHFADGTATAYNLPQIRVTIEPATMTAEETAGMFGFRGSTEEADFFALDAELDFPPPPEGS